MSNKLAVCMYLDDADNKRSAVAGEVGEIHTQREEERREEEEKREKKDSYLLLIYKSNQNTSW